MTYLDTNILIDLFEGDAPIAERALRAIEAVAGDGPVAVCAAVYAEFCVGSQRDVDDVANDLRSAGIVIDVTGTFDVWRKAAFAYSGYAARRIAANAAHPRRILADFVIGAAADVKGAAFVTRDAAFFRRAFPTLRVVDPE